MKANEAPEKVILSADRDTQVINDEWVLNDYTDNIKIEYTRTDTFVEKACSWLKENCKNYIIVDIDNKYEGIDGLFLEDFLKYMKGE